MLIRLKYKLQQSILKGVFLCLFLNFTTLIVAQNQTDEDDYKVSLAPVFGSHMVLQQNEPISIWGEAISAAKITVSLGEKKQETIASVDGKWQVTFEAMKATFKPINLRVNNLRLEDILVGEVWICSGQSNMEFQLSRMGGYDSITKHKPNKNIRFLKHKNIRIVAREGYTEEELARCNTQDFFKASWKETTAAMSTEISALAYVFASDLYKKLQVPVGIIQVSVGGSALNNWIPKEALESNPLTADIFKKDWFSNEQIRSGHRKRAKEAFQNVSNFNEPYLAGQFKYRWVCEPSFLFEAGIVPLKKIAFRGVLWYQGEADTETLEMVNIAKMQFPLLIHEWRKYLNMGDFPFIYVQLPGNKNTFWPDFRNVQEETLKVTKNTNMVSTIDLGAENNTHPKDKEPIGNRASRLAFKKVYGFSDILGFPKLEKWTINNHQIILTLNECGSGIHSSQENISGFEIADENGIFQKVKVKIEGQNRLVVTSPKNPAFLRYGWIPFPKPALSLFNSEQLPLPPFSIELNKSN